MPALVRKTTCGRSFIVVDPASYPYGNGCFDEEEPIHAAWCRFGEGAVLVDVGASFGAFTLPALAGGATVIAFEPSRDGVRILRENLSANRWTNRCTINQRALFDGGTYPKELAASVFGISYPADNVVYTSLDLHVFDRIDAIKIDVEGGELGVLRGGLDTIERCRPVLLIEDHDGITPGHIVSDYPQSISSHNEIVSLLEARAYRVETRIWPPNRKYVFAEPC